MRWDESHGTRTRRPPADDVHHLWHRMSCPRLMSNINTTSLTRDARACAPIMLHSRGARRAATVRTTTRLVNLIVYTTRPTPTTARCSAQNARAHASQHFRPRAHDAHWSTAKRTTGTCPPLLYWKPRRGAFTCASIGPDHVNEFLSPAANAALTPRVLF